MSDAISTPTSTPNAAVSDAATPAAPTDGGNPVSAAPSDGAPAASGATPDVATATEAQKASARLALSSLDPSTEIEMVVDGKVRVMTAAEATRMLQVNAAAGDRFKAAKEKARTAEAREAAAMRALQDPSTAWETIEALGLDPAAFAEQMMQRRLAESQMTPEQRELREMKRREAQRQQYEQQMQQQHIQAQTQRHQAMYQNAFNVAMDDAGLPANPAVRSRLMSDLAGAVAEAVEAGTRLTREQLAGLAREAYRPIRESALSSFSAEERRAFYGSNLDELRAFMASVSEQPSAPSEPQAAAKPTIPGVRPVDVAPRDDSGRFQPQSRAQTYRAGSVDAWRRSLGNG